MGDSEPFEIQHIRAEADVRRAEVELDMRKRIEQYYKSRLDRVLRGDTQAPDPTSGGASAPDSSGKCTDATACKEKNAAAAATKSRRGTDAPPRVKNRCAETGCKRAILASCRRRCCGQCCFSLHLDKCPEVPVNRRTRIPPPAQQPAHRTVALKKPPGTAAKTPVPAAPRPTTGGKNPVAMKELYKRRPFHPPWNSPSNTEGSISEEEEEEEESSQ